MRNYGTLARVAERTATLAATRGLTLAVEQVHMIGKGAARLVVSHTAGDYCEDDYRKAVAGLYENRVALVEGTVQDVSSDHATQSSLFVSLNTLSKPFSEEATKGMSVVTANVFADPSDNTIWSVRGDGAARALVQQSNDDLAAILQARRSRMITTAGFTPSTLPENGDYVMYLDEASLTTRFGMTMRLNDGDICVVDRQAGDARRIGPHQILAAANDLEVDVGVRPYETKTALSSDMGNRMLAYWRKLFGSNTAYFARLEQLVRSKAVMS